MSDLHLINWLQVIILLAILLVGIVKKKQEKPKSEVAYEHELLYEAMKKASNAIVLIDVNNKILFWNKGAENMFGWEYKDVKGKDLTIIIPPEYRDRHLEGMRQLRETGTSRILGKPFRSKGWHRLEVEIDIEITISSFPIGTVTHYSGHIRSIREKIELENEIALLNSGEELARYGTWSWDISSNRVRVSDGFNMIWENDDEVNDFEYIMKRIYYMDKERVAALLAEAVETKKDYEVTYRIVKLSGEPVWIYAKGRSKVRPNGTTEKIVGFIRQMKNKEEADELFG